MDDKTLEKIKKQHIDSYKNAILDIVDNNTSALIADIKTLIKKPPLETMDLIKVKFLSLAKKNKIVLNTEKLDGAMDDFRNYLFKIDVEINRIRSKHLKNIVNSCDLRDNNTIKLNKKDFVDINKKIKKIIKDYFGKAMNKLLDSSDNIFNDNVDEDIKNKILADLKKYIKNTYLKQLIENCDIKILVKDITLINSIKEQAERYIFTLKNSRVLNDLDA